MSSIDVVGCQMGVATQSLIRIAIFPVGKINAATFKKFVSMVQSCDSKPIKSLTRFRDDNLRSPFQKQDWARSVLHFQFVDETSINTGYPDFHQYRNVHGVIGIMSCLSEDSVASGFTKYKKQKLQLYGKSVVGRCFAVEQDPEIMAPEDEELVVIPNQDVNHVEFHIDYLFSDLARQVLIRFEKIASNPTAYFTELSNTHLMSSVPTTNQSIPIGTAAKKITTSKSKAELSTIPTTSQNSQPSTPVTTTTQGDEKNLQNMKLFADCALLISDYEDAMVTYQEINGICKQQITNNNTSSTINYPLYQAGSSEGMAAVLFAKSKLSPKIDSDKPVIQQIYDLLQESISCYEKSKKKDLLVESYIKLAVFISNFGDKKKRKEALDCLSKAVQSAVTLTTQEKIIVSGFSAKICRQMKCKRKFGFFLRHVALLHNELCNQGVSIRLGAQFLDAYHIPLELTPHTEWKTTKNILAQRGWYSVQIDIIKNMIEFSQSMSPADYATEIQFRLYLLSEYYPVLQKLAQEEQFKRIMAISHQIPKNINIQLKSLPILKTIAPLKLPSHLEPKEIEIKQNKSQLFIYSPFDKKDETLVKLNWAKNEISQVVVEFYNPFKIDLRFKNVSVRFKPEISPIVDNGEPICDVYVHNAIVLSGTSQKVTIATKPRHVGKIILDAVGVEFEEGRFKTPIYLPITTQHLVNDKKEKREYDIDVIETVPLLNVTLSTPQLSLVDGETTTLFAKLQNTGNCKISFLEITFNNQTANIVSITDNIIQKHLPMVPDADVVTIPIEVTGCWKGSSDIGNINIHIRYGIDEEQLGKAYFREMDLSIKTTVLRAIVVEDCITVNESFNKKIVAKIHNYSNSSFMLLSSISRYLEDEQFDTGIPFGAQSTKMILVDPSILHNINFEELNIPYTASINSYKNIIADAMRWKSVSFKVFLFTF